MEYTIGKEKSRDDAERTGFTIMHTDGSNLNFEMKATDLVASAFSEFAGYTGKRTHTLELFHDGMQVERYHTLAEVSAFCKLV